MTAYEPCTVISITMTILRKSVNLIWDCGVTDLVSSGVQRVNVGLLPPIPSPLLLNWICNFHENGV